MKNFKEKGEISIHLCKVWMCLKQNPKWMTTREIGEKVEGVAIRTISMHLLYLVKSGLVDQIEVFPGHRYKMSEMPSKRNTNYNDRIEKACEVLMQ
jgi:DNA-binding transcriptional ArsR family regulator